MKAKFHLEATAMAAQELARFNLGIMEAESGNMEPSMKNWTIAASVGHFIPCIPSICTFPQNVMAARKTTKDTILDNQPAKHHIQVTLSTIGKVYS